jgi:two-component system chemotaxis response regulator CheB
MSAPTSPPIRVMIVDDSAFARHAISKYLKEIAPDIEIVGTAWNGYDALQQMPTLNPDVITLDMNMPQMNGIMTLKEIMVTRPCPVIMVSALTQEGAQETLDALNLGAVDFVAKPVSQTHLTQVIEELAEKIRAAARAKIMPVSVRVSPVWPRGEVRRLREYEKVVVIGASTGGPRALEAVLPNLPGDLPAAVLAVQHMPPPFTRSLAERLNSHSAVFIQEAEAGMVLEAGRVFIAPGGIQMEVSKAGQVVLNRTDTVNGVCPAVDVTMSSVARTFGNRILGVVLTGMGRDGTYGAKLIRQAGGLVIAEHASTCVVWGMPRSVVEADAADFVVPLPEIAAMITRIVKGSSHGQ